MRFFASQLLASAVLGFVLCMPARAETIDFSYSWNVLPSTSIPSGTGSVTLSPAASGNAQYTYGAVMPTFIPGAEVTTTSSATSPADSFNSPFHMVLSLKDTTSGQMGDLTFDGTIAGTLTFNQSTLTSTFQSPVTQTLTLGGHLYAVTIDPTVAQLPAPGSPITASINAQVTVSDVTTPPPMNQVPEPTSLVLGATALLGFATRRFLQRKKA